MPLEGVDGLVDKGDAVGQKQHTLDPVAPHQQVAQRDDRAGLARAGRHDDQRLPLVVLSNASPNAADARVW